MRNHMKLHSGVLYMFLLGAIAFGLAAPGRAGEFSIARIYIEYNSTPRDLGFHISLDGEDWRSLKIINPRGKIIFEVAGKGAFRELGMTELFFEGAEPALADFPLEDLLELFPEGPYRFVGTTVDGARLDGVSHLTHAVPDGPVLDPVEVGKDTVIIKWKPVTAPPSDFPAADIEIVGYQVILEDFQVTLPASSTSVTVPKEFVRSLEPGVLLFEVLAIESGGNQTITEGSFNFNQTDSNNDDN